jgi:hypothetical protein
VPGGELAGLRTLIAGNATTATPPSTRSSGRNGDEDERLRDLAADFGAKVIDAAEYNATKANVEEAGSGTRSAGAGHEAPDCRRRRRTARLPKSWCTARRATA